MGYSRRDCRVVEERKLPLQLHFRRAVERRCVVVERARDDVGEVLFKEHSTFFQERLWSGKGVGTRWWWSLDRVPSVVG